MSAVKALFRRIFRGELHYLFGRFYVVRRLYGTVQHLLQRIGVGRPRHRDGASTIWPDMDERAAATELGTSSVVFGFDLPRDDVERMVAYAREQPCTTAGSEERFKFEDVKDGLTPGGDPVALAWVEDPGGCPEVDRLRGDPVLNAVVRDYLGYAPRHADPLMYWSPVSDLSDEARRLLSQTIDFHFDVHGWNFVYAHFYLTDTDKGSGAHVAVLGSHRKKPFKMLIGSARATEDAIAATFGLDRVVTIEGAAGTGFIEDTSCFHRAMSPTDRPRLMLQLRFH